MTAATAPALYELRPPERTNLHGTDTAGRDHLSHSSLKTFLACQQQYAFHYEDRLAPAVTKEPLQMGRAFAYALEHANPNAGHTLLLTDAQAEARRASGNPWVTAPDERDTLTAATIVREAARCYLTRYGAHQDTREVELRARIRNPHAGGRYSLTHDLVGRVDAISTDGTVMFEDKLMGQLPQRSLAARVKLDRQVSIGAYLWWRATGIVVSEIRYRVTRKPQIRQRKDETHDAYLHRIAAEYATRPDDYLMEEPAERTEHDFLRLEREIWAWAEQVRSARREGTWPRNTGACFEYGGCRFLALCGHEPGAEHQYVTRPLEQPQALAAGAEVERERPKEAA